MPRDSGDASFELGPNFGPELNKLRLECRKLSGETQQWEKPDRCRDSVAVLGFYNNLGDAGTAKIRGSRTRHHSLWVGVWVGDLPEKMLFGLSEKGIRFRTKAEEFESSGAYRIADVRFISEFVG